MNLGIRLVDAFAASAFTGNPAGVCILNEPLDLSTMQAVAMEVNAAETAFLYKEGDVYNLIGLRLPLKLIFAAMQLWHQHMCS